MFKCFFIINVNDVYSSLIIILVICKIIVFFFVDKVILCESFYKVWLMYEKCKDCVKFCIFLLGESIG